MYIWEGDSNMRIDFVKKSVEGNKLRLRVLINGIDNGNLNIAVNRTYKNVCILSADSKILTKDVLTQFAAQFKGMDIYIRLHPLEVRGEVSKILSEVPDDEVYKTTWNSSSTSAQRIYKLKTK